MTREAKVGLMMVAVLVGVFGFLVYKRVHRPSQALASTKTLDDHEHDQGGDEEPAGLPRHERDFGFDDRKPHGLVEKIENTVEAAADEFEQEVQALAKAKPKLKRHAPTREPEPSTKDDDFAQFEPPRTGADRHQHQRIEVPEPVENDFDQLREEATKVDVVTAERQELQSDPFDSELKARPIDYNKKSIRQVSSDPFDTEPAETTSTEAPPAATQEFEAPIEEPRRVREFEERNDFAPRGKRQAAPVSLAEDDFASPPARRDEQSSMRGHDREISHEAGRPRQHEFDRGRSMDNESGIVGGPTYTVQPNENFWIISRKRYGAGRFYMALAMHNQQAVPDPKNMRPGVVIQTPEIGELEQRYGNVIPKSAPPDSFQPMQTARATRPREVEPAGYFMSPEGFPMYRVGDRDTLTDIAKTHLGRSSRWVQILEMNRNVLRDGNALKIGTELRLPADAIRVRVADGSREFR